MSGSKWVETKKESEVNERGELVPKRVTLELEKEKENPWKYKPKELIDLLLRLIGVAAIAIPIILFYKGQQAEGERQKALYQLDVYTRTSTELHTLISKHFESHEFDSIKGKLADEIYPKIVLLNDSRIIDTFNLIKDAIIFSTLVTRIRNFNNPITDLIGLFKPNNPKTDLSSPLENLSKEGIQLQSVYRSWRANKVKSFIDKYLSIADRDIDTITIISDYATYIAYPLNGETQSHDVNYRRAFINSIPKQVMGYYTGFDEDFTKGLLKYTSILDSMMVRSNKVLYNQ